MSRLPPLLAEGRGRGVALVAALALGQALGAGLAAFATRDVFTSIAGAGAALPGTALAVLVAAGALIAGLRVAERAVAERVGQGYAAALRQTLFDHLARMPAHEVARRRSGALAIRFVGDLGAVRAWVSVGVSRAISAAIVAPGAFAALVLIDPALAAAAALPLLPCALAMAWLAPRLGPLHRRLRNRRARLAADMTERITVAPELRLLGRGALERRRLAASASALCSAAVERARASATLRALPDVAASAAGALVLATAFLTGAGSAEAAAALAVLGIVALPLRDLAGIWDRRRAFEVARDKCLSVLDAPRLETLGERRRGGRGPAGLEFVEASARRVKRVSVTAAPGAKVAIVGGNGAGKSTLLALAAGLEHASSGKVRLDGVDIRGLDPRARSHEIVYLGPRSPILRGSLRRALSLGVDPRPDDAAIEAAARSFGLDEVLRRLGGLGGRVAEGGRNLSAGEACRVRLVRAALARPRLLLLDEPEEALDGAGRALVARLLAGLEATALVVTHDLALARGLDRVWCLDDGALVEHGPPAQVLLGDGAAGWLFDPRCAA